MEQNNIPSSNNRFENQTKEYILETLLDEYLEYYYGNMTSLMTIIDFTKNYQKKTDIETRFYNDFNERKAISPDHKYLINEWIDAIEYRQKHVDYHDLMELSVRERLMIDSYRCIRKGENPILLHELFKRLYDRINDFKNHHFLIDDHDLEGIVLGVQDAYNMQYLQIELKKLEIKNEVNQSSNINSTQEKQIEPEQEKLIINQAHIVRGLFELVTSLNGNHHRTNIAKLAYFLINGKEASQKKEYQPLLNAISADNKQLIAKTEKAEKETIKKYLHTLNLLKEKM